MEHPSSSDFITSRNWVGEQENRGRLGVTGGVSLDIGYLLPSTQSLAEVAKVHITLGSNWYAAN